MDTPPSGGRASSGMIPNRSTSGAAQGETPDAVAHLLGMPKLAVAARQIICLRVCSTSGAAQRETPDAVTTRLGMPKLAVAARQIICLRVCSGKASEAPERISPW